MVLCGFRKFVTLKKYMLVLQKYTDMKESMVCNTHVIRFVRKLYVFACGRLKADSHAAKYSNVLVETII